MKLKLLLGAVLTIGAFANDLTDPSINVALQWNDQAVTAIKVAKMPPTVAARALYIVHAAMYDAWAAYDTTAVGTLPGWPGRQPASVSNFLNKSAAVTYAAYRTLADLFPAQLNTFTNEMINLGYDPSIKTTSTSTPPGVGNAAAAVQIAFRHSDGANQLGDLGGGAYADYTGYQPVNTPDTLTDPNHWQPLISADGTAQTFLSAQWSKVAPFALKSADQFRPGPQPQAGSQLSQRRIGDVMRLNAALDDTGKMSAEYWEDATGTETSPGHWNRLGEEISNRDKHSLDDDVKMFFALNAAELDASISVWDAKRFYDSIRPVSAIRFNYAGQTIQGWAGAGQGVAAIDGSQWKPWIPTPAYPEFPSVHSAFSNAAAEILKRFVGSDTFARSQTFAAGSSKYDPGASPAAATTLEWMTFSEIAEDASYSGHTGGVQFDEADYRARIMGREVAGLVWTRYIQLLNGGQ